jgi:serine/threonine protein kinase
MPPSKTSGAAAPRAQPPGNSAQSSTAACQEDCFVGRNPGELWEIQALIGQGSYGKVYRATSRATSRLVAFKVLPLEEDAISHELLMELNSLRRCDHPNIVRYHSSYVFDAQLWIAMEYCSVSALGIMRQSRQPFAEVEVAAVCAEALRGLDYLHSVCRLIHRDVKAGNILLTEAGNVKLADFGVAAQISGTLAKRSTVIGSPMWMSPEMIVDGSYDFKTDIWSLGITAIELAQFNPPHHNVSPPLRVLFLIPQLPPPTLEPAKLWSDAFVHFISRCLRKDPRERPDAAECLRFVLDCTDGSTGGSTSGSTGGSPGGSTGGSTGGATSRSAATCSGGSRGSAPDLLPPSLRSHGIALERLMVRYLQQRRGGNVESAAANVVTVALENTLPATIRATASSAAALAAACLTASSGDAEDAEDILRSLNRTTEFPRTLPYAATTAAAATAAAAHAGAGSVGDPACPTLKAEPAGGAQPLGVAWHASAHHGALPLSPQPIGVAAQACSGIGAVVSTSHAAFALTSPVSASPFFSPALTLRAGVSAGRSNVLPVPARLHASPMFSPLFSPRLTPTHTGSSMSPMHSPALTPVDCAVDGSTQAGGTKCCHAPPANGLSRASSLRDSICTTLRRLTESETNSALSESAGSVEHSVTWV